MSVPDYPHVRLLAPRLPQHPSVFRRALQADAPLAPGTVADVVDAQGRFLARGFWNGHARIGLRVLTRDAGEIIDAAWIAARIDAAVAQRARGLDPRGQPRLVDALAGVARQHAQADARVAVPEAARQEAALGIHHVGHAAGGQPRRRLQCAAEQRRVLRQTRRQQAYLRVGRLVHRRPSFSSRKKTSARKLMPKNQCAPAPKYNCQPISGTRTPKLQWPWRAMPNAATAPACQP